MKNKIFLVPLLLVVTYGVASEEHLENRLELLSISEGEVNLLENLKREVQRILKEYDGQLCRYLETIPDKPSRARARGFGEFAQSLELSQILERDKLMNWCALEAAGKLMQIKTCYLPPSRTIAWQKEKFINVLDRAMHSMRMRIKEGRLTPIQRDMLFEKIRSHLIRIIDARPELV